MVFHIINKSFAGVSELADETDSKSVVSNGVWVRVPPPAPNISDYFQRCFFFFSFSDGRAIT